MNTARRASIREDGVWKVCPSRRSPLAWAILVGITVGTLAVGTFAPGASSAEPRVLDPGQRPADVRLQPLKDLNGYFPFQVPESQAAWQQRAARLRRQILVSQGLWPMPTKHPLQAVIHGRIEKEAYTVEKVYFQSMPGLYVTGNLYRPRQVTGAVPGILCPHGHWANGRFHDCGVASVRQQIVQGAERFEDGGRSPLQSRCVQLARMGCVVFHWDMLGYADSQQIPAAVIHRFETQRPEMNQPERWGLFSPQAESRMQSPMGLQTYNAIRALDFLESLPDVDADRIAVTGASGGGTQTFILSAIDPRPAVSFPAVMVSTAMQGGCTCENACGLRIGTGNVEIAALFAPKPLGLTAANDWTKEMATKGFPQLQQLFQLLGAEDHVMLKSLVHFGHNYNYVSRAAMYSWFNKHLQLGLSEPIVEEAYPRLSEAELTVWNADHPQPEGGPEIERQLLAWWTKDAQQQLAALHPTDAESLSRYRQVVGDGMDIVIGRGLPDPEQLDFKPVQQIQQAGYLQVQGLLSHQLPASWSSGRPDDHGTATEQLPVVLLDPQQDIERVVVWLGPNGKADLFQADGSPQPAVQRLIDSRVAVVGADLFLQGEFLEPGQEIEATRTVDNPREAAAYTFGYNHSLFARRVHDILSVVAYAKNQGDSLQIDLVGLAGAGPWVAAARAQARTHVTCAAIDTRGFRFAEVRSLQDPAFLPGAAKYDDLPGMLAVAAPAALWIAGESDASVDWLEAAYKAAGKPARITAYQGTAANLTQAAVDWLLKN